MTPGINTLLLSTGALGSFTCSGMTLPIYMGPTALRGIRATGDTLSNVESQVFTPYKFGSTAGDRTPDLLTTRPTCYHSATALYINVHTTHRHTQYAHTHTYIIPQKYFQVKYLKLYIISNYAMTICCKIFTKVKVN